jgi:hypothetical protein
VRIHNLGDTPAVNATVKVKYTRPWAAPDDWVPCRDGTNNALEETVSVPALDYVDFTFARSWRPQVAQVPNTDLDWGDHYCLLVEVEHNDDALQYDDSTAAGSDPWTRNIKGSNNVALRNLHIH